MWEGAVFSTRLEAVNKVVQDRIREWLVEETSFCPTVGTVGCLAPGWPKGLSQTL